jgi:nitrogenase subunit NifH
MNNVQVTLIKNNRDYLLNLGKNFHNTHENWEIYDILIDKITHREIVVCGYYLNPKHPFLEYIYVLFDDGFNKIYTLDETTAKIDYFKPNDKLLPEKIINNIKSIDKIQKNIYNINDKIKYIGGNIV